MKIDQQTLTTLNFYRASELCGGLALGRLAQRVRDPDLALALTEHSAEEIVHARLWAETILRLGGRPWPTRDTYQARYTAVLGPPASLLQVLALTQVFERRVYRHFLEHLRRPGTHPLVKITLRRMIEEEKNHLSWVKRWLDEQAMREPQRVRDIMRRYAEADEKIYASLRRDRGWRHVA